MQINFYVASSLGNADEARALCDKLESLGHRCTYRWFDTGKVDPSEWERVAVKEFNGVTDAAVVILLLPGKFGAHTEFGAALAQGADVIVASPKGAHFEDGPVTGTYPSIFYFLPGVHRIAFEDREELHASVLAYMGEA